MNTNWSHINDMDIERISINEFKAIFWDFDGVIKESNEAKTKGYLSLFAEYGHEVQKKIQTHHMAHEGISRYEKIPFYFKKYLGIKLSPNQNEEYCKRYGDFTQKAVIESQWVPGVKRYLEMNYKNQDFFLVTGTSQEDIETILVNLDIQYMFREVWGAPAAKASVLKDIIEKYQLLPSDCLMVGDSKIDYDAANASGVQFLLRLTETNRSIFQNFFCPKVKDFKGQL
jgi:phosphoglycolate phosphatase-like HAD superfamily hydrolase